MTTALENFSMSGKTSLNAWRGQGQLTIPFANIYMVVFGDSQGDAVTALALSRSRQKILPGLISPDAVWFNESFDAETALRSSLYILCRNYLITCH